MKFIWHNTFFKQFITKYYYKKQLNFANMEENNHPTLNRGAAQPAWKDRNVERQNDFQHLWCNVTFGHFKASLRGDTRGRELCLKPKQLQNDLLP